MQNMENTSVTSSVSSVQRIPEHPATAALPAGVVAQGGPFRLRGRRRCVVGMTQKRRTPTGHSHTLQLVSQPAGMREAANSYLGFSGNY